VGRKVVSPEQVFTPEQRLALNELMADYLRKYYLGTLSDLREAVAKLIHAQTRTEARLDALAARMEELAQAQARTEARLDALAARMEELAQAQARTEARLDALAARVDTLAVRVDELAQAQARTEKTVRELARQVGGLSEAVGGGLEDLSYEVLPYVLEKELALELGELGREYVAVDGEEIEFNIFGTGFYREQPERKVVLLGEVKSNITTTELKRFARLVRRARPHLAPAEVIPVFFGFRARPAVRELARKEGVNLIFSYGKLMLAD
jgi:prefoldin subunit 5